MQTTHRNLDAGKTYRKLKDLGLSGGDAERYIAVAERDGSFNCGMVLGKRVVIRKNRKKQDDYLIDVYS